MHKDISQFFEQFLYEAEFIKKLRPETIRGYTNTYLTFTKLVPNLSSVDDITSQTLSHFFKTLQERKRFVGKGIIKTGIKRSTAASYWCKLNAFFSWLALKGHIKESPFKAMKYPSPSYDDKKYLQEDEIERILAALHVTHTGSTLLYKRNLAIFHLFLFCGLRKEEVMLLQLRDIDFGRKLITIRSDTSKSGRTRQIPLHTTTILHLKDYLVERKGYKTQYLIVSSTQDEGLRHEGFRHLIDRIRRLSGVRFHWHQLRHTFAVNFLRATNNIFKLKVLLGHQDIRVTTIYLRCLPPEELRGDIEAMRIDSFL